MAIIVMSVAKPTSDVLIFGLAEQKAIRNSSRENGTQQHFVSFSPVRRSKKFVTAMNMKTKLTPKPFLLA